MQSTYLENFLILQDFDALDTLLDDRFSSPEPADYPMDEAEPSEDEDNVDDPNAFNLDQDEPVDIEPPHAKMENLAETQRFISLIANATFEEEEKQWSESEYENFISIRSHQIPNSILTTPSSVSPFRYTFPSPRSLRKPCMKPSIVASRTAILTRRDDALISRGSYLSEPDDRCSANIHQYVHQNMHCICRHICTPQEMPFLWRTSIQNCQEGREEEETGT